MKGRGASHNAPNRFEPFAYEPDDESCGDAAPRPGTQFLPDASKTIIASNDSPDVGFDRSVNPYRGCEHGCVYCYARPTHEYLGFSAGLDFETRIMVKHDAAALLRKELSSPKWRPQVVGISGVTDPYQPVERKLGLTRACLEVFAEFRNPVVIVTKNRLVTRDIDLLRQLARHHGVAVLVSMTTLDLALNRVLEPRTSSPAQRLIAISELAAAGVPVGSLVAPTIPGLTDHEMPAILKAVADAGGSFASYVMLRLPLAVAPLFERWLSEHYPEREDKVLNRMKAVRRGGLYDARFGTRMKGEGVFAEQIERVFSVACRKAGLNRERPVFSTDAFRIPEHVAGQMNLFG